MPSLTLLTIRLYSMIGGWDRRFGRVLHSQVGGLIDLPFTVFSLYQFHHVVPQIFILENILPSGTLRWVLSSTTSGYRPSDSPLNSSYLDGLYSPSKSLPYFMVLSVLCRQGGVDGVYHWLNIFSFGIIPKQRQHLFPLNFTPARVLVFCLRHFTLC